jgi:hypothetical protein
MDILTSRTPTYRPLRLILVLEVALCLVTVACSASTGAKSAASTPAASATSSQPIAKTKPTALPQVTLAFCEHILSLAEANQLMQAPPPATTIFVDSVPTGGGSCNYDFALDKAIVIVAFLGIVPEGASISSLASKLDNASGAGTTYTTTPVSGVGDQAVFVTATNSQVHLKVDSLDIIYGAIFMDCNNLLVGSTPDATERARLTNVCQLVISRL